MKSMGRKRRRSMTSINKLSDSELADISQFGRFTTINKSKAFALMEELDKRSPIREEKGKKYRLKYRVGQVISDRIAIDIDNHDIDNLNKVNSFYSNLYQNPFSVVKTSNGYHLIQKQPCKDFDYDACRLLNPTLKQGEEIKYREAIYNFNQKLKEERDGKEFTRTQLQNLTKEMPDRLKNEGLFSGVGLFDIVHALNGIGRCKYVLRISKKSPDDVMEAIP